MLKTGGAQRNAPRAFQYPTPPAQVGEVVYMANCQQCHKTDLTGTLPEVPALTGIVDRIGADQVKEVLKDGQGPDAFVRAAFGA